MIFIKQFKIVKTIVSIVDTVWDGNEGKNENHPHRRIANDYHSHHAHENKNHSQIAS